MAGAAAHAAHAGSIANPAAIALATLLAGRTSFVVAHRLSTIRNADHVLVLDRREHGALLEEAHPHRLIVAAPSLEHLEHGLAAALFVVARCRHGPTVLSRADD